MHQKSFNYRFHQNQRFHLLVVVVVEDRRKLLEGRGPQGQGGGALQGGAGEGRTRE